MFVCTRGGMRRASGLLSRSGVSPLAQAGPSSTQLKFSRSESTAASGSNDSAPSSSSSSFEPESSDASQKRWSKLPYPAHFLKLKNKFNPSPLSPNYISRRLIKGKGPHQRSDYALRKPIENDIAGTPGHHFMKWRASWHINRRRVNLWREAKNQWRHKLRKEGVIPPYIPRTSGPGTKTPRVKYVMSKHRPGRMYIRGRDGRPRRMTTKWLVFPDGRRVRKVGWRRVNKGRIILASVAKIGLNDRWTRPIAQGRLEVYDHAMEFLAKDQAKLKQEIVDLRKAVRQLEEFSPEWQKLKDKINILEIQSDINLPNVRWDVQQGHYDFKNPTHRHLVEDKWRKQGRLDLLMERVYQMGVVPDLVPNFHPNIDVHVEFPIRPPYGKAYAEEAANRIKPRYADMEPGRFLLPNQTLEPPIVRARAFHVDPRQYTLVMVDPDVPDVNNGTYQSFLHWVVPNITLSIHSTSFRLKLSQLPQLSYIPPHPQEGTNYHRYTIFLLRQSKHVNLPAHESIRRLGFNLREFIQEHKLMVPEMPVSPVEYPPLPSDVQPGNPRWVGRADPNLIEGGIPGGIRPGGIPGMPGPMGGREARWAVPKGVRQNAGISGRSGGRGKEDEIGGGVFMWREEHDGEEGVVHKIYKEILQVPEPKYARPKRGDPLEAVKRVKKYNFARY